MQGVGQNLKDFNKEKFHCMCMCNCPWEAHNFEVCFFYTGSSRIIVGYYRDWYKGLPGRRPF
jgi:hypothetical protein